MLRNTPGFFQAAKATTLQRLHNVNFITACPKIASAAKQQLITRTENPHVHLTHMSYENFIGPVIAWQDTIKIPSSEAAIYSENPAGWYLINYKNTMIGSCATTPKSNGTSWLGYFYIVEKHRQCKFGHDAFTAVLNADQQQGYVFPTFLCLESLVNMYQRQWQIMPASFDNIYRYQSSTIHPNAEITDRIIDNALFEEICTYDTSIQCGYQRPDFLSRWICMPGSQAMIARDEEKIIGFCVTTDFIYPTNDMYKKHKRIGPLYADSQAVAEQLIKANLSASVFIDADGNNPQAQATVNSFKFFDHTLKLARMQRSNAPKYYDEERCYSLASYGSGV